MKKKNLRKSAHKNEGKIAQKNSENLQSSQKKWQQQ